MIPRVYIETTIPSFYFEARVEPDMAARREWTRKWWEASPGVTDLVTSVAVLDELRRGRFAFRSECLNLMRAVEILPIDRSVREIVAAYIGHNVMPADPVGDALHLAIASYHRCDFLLTWNCKHLANANKFEHIRRVNTLLGLFVPALVTPLELLGEAGDDR